LLREFYNRYVAKYCQQGSASQIATQETSSTIRGREVRVELRQQQLAIVEAQIPTISLLAVFCSLGRIRILVF